MKCPPFKQFLGMAALFALSTGFLAAQSKPAPAPAPNPGGGNAGGATGGIPGNNPGPTTTNPIPGQTQPGQSNFPTFQRPIYIQGKVMMENGGPPPDSVVIERICGGTARPEGYTDSKGRFSIELGRNNQMLADASTSSPMDVGGSRGQQLPGGGRQVTERDLMGCELHAALAGFRSETVNLGGRRMMDNPEIGTIILHPLTNVQGYTISATTAMAPKEAKKAYEKALDQMKKNKLADAKASLEKAVEAYPKYALAWHELGLANELENNPEEARRAYAEALKADSKFVKPYIQLAGISLREKKWQEAADTSANLIKLNPYDFPAAYYFNAVANLNMQQFDEAEKSVREAVKLDTRHIVPKANHVLGVILANRQDYAGAAASMKAYLELVPNGNDGDFVRKQLADVEKSLAAKNDAASPSARQ